MDSQTWDPTLRPARFADVPELARLDRVCFRDHAYSPQLILRFLELGLPCVVAEGPDGEVVGFAMAMPDAGEPTGLLVTLDVTPEVRRGGLGTRMVRWCARELLGTEPRPQAMWLTVASANTGARAFYESLGFHEVDSIEGYYGDDDAVVMVHGDLGQLSGNAATGRRDGGPSEI